MDLTSHTQNVFQKTILFISYLSCLSTDRLIITFGNYCLQERLNRLVEYILKLSTLKVIKSVFSNVEYAIHRIFTPEPSSEYVHLQGIVSFLSNNVG